MGLEHSQSTRQISRRVEEKPREDFSEEKLIRLAASVLLDTSMDIDHDLNETSLKIVLTTLNTIRNSNELAAQSMGELPEEKIFALAILLHTAKKMNARDNIIREMVINILRNNTNRK